MTYDRRTASTNVSLSDFFQGFFTAIAEGLQRELGAKYEKIRVTPARGNDLVYTVDVIIGGDGSGFDCKVTCQMEPKGVSFKVERFRLQGNNWVRSSTVSGLFSASLTPSEAAGAIAKRVEAEAFNPY